MSIYHFFLEDIFLHIKYIKSNSSNKVNIDIPFK